MWKNILASFLLIIGIVEIVLALHAGLREAVMQNSPLRSKRTERHVLLIAGIAALVMAMGLFFYGAFW